MRYVPIEAAAVANALVTASFGIAQQAYLMKEGKITQWTYGRLVGNAEIRDVLSSQIYI